MDETPTTATRRLKQQGAEINRSARAVEKGVGELTVEADRRTVLAADRTLLAAERTYAAWMRTALAALAGGIGATALAKGVLPEWVGKISGSVLVIFAAFCLFAAVWRELRGIAQLKHHDIRPVPKALLIPINFFLLLVALAALVGIWSS